MDTVTLIDDQAVKVTVTTAYMPEQSNELKEQFVFSYTVTISNNTEQQVQLLNRFWRIHDANGNTSTVNGKGVIGEQPKILPGQSYTYSSGCILQTPLGTMEGHYEMVNTNNELLKVPIEVFRLAQPNILN